MGGWRVAALCVAVTRVQRRLAVDPLLSVTCTVKDDEPATVGVPENVPAEDDGPGGSVPARPLTGA